MSKIIVADDDFVQRDLYFELFKENGYDVISANDGLDAWEKIQKNLPDLVFTGILMPRMTGFELVEKMRSTPSLEHVPVIIFSHLGKPEDRKKAAALPLVDFRVKGFDGPIKILKYVREVLSNQSYAPRKPFKPEEDDRQGVTQI